jgi:hypothetical protein
MITVSNSETLQALQKQAGLSQGIDATPNTLGNQIIPVLECNPKLQRHVTFVKTSSSTVSASGASLYTTAPTKDFYLTSAYFYMTKDATCDVAIGLAGITAIVGGLSFYVIGISRLTTTAQDQGVYINFPQPIKIDRNTAITISAFSYTAGLSARTYGIMGYYDEGSL